MSGRQLFITSMSMLLLVGITACTTDRAAFVTKTSLAILDVDSSPASLSIAYDRKEGFVGPAYNGVAPPVIAIIKSDAKVFNPKIKQLYATGKAATLVSNNAPGPLTAEPMSGDGDVMFFGTTTNIGLKIAVEPTEAGIPVPNNFVFGFRRKEFSLIPIQKSTASDGTTAKTYPSVLAQINTDATGNLDTNGNPVGGLKNIQYFATGIAAQNMAIVLRPEFIHEAETLFGKYRVERDKQRQLAASILTCFAGIGIENRLAVLADANRLELLSKDEEDNFEAMKGVLEDKKVVDNGKILNPNKLARVYRAYADSISNAEGFNTVRFKLMELHEKKVCEFSTKNQTPN